MGGEGSSVQKPWSPEQRCCCRHEGYRDSPKRVGCAAGATSWRCPKSRGRKRCEQDFGQLESFRGKLYGFCKRNVLTAARLDCGHCIRKSIRRLSLLPAHFLDEYAI